MEPISLAVPGYNGVQMSELKTWASLKLPAFQSSCDTSRLILWDNQLVLTGQKDDSVILAAIPLLSKRMTNVSFVNRLQRLHLVNNLTLELQNIASSLGSQA